ncbi:hypothetical protein [Hyalangium versicolor]|uniref:hypothetical protein n=1 Tax=Hyalangium versicolor TaxID=2861190 RepID=UPI001CC94FAF|nr:hypothetical protein [Hyalangium versicolor]
MRNKRNEQMVRMLVLGLAVWASGCAKHRESSGGDYFGAERARLAKLDDFDMLLTKAGVAEEDLPLGEVLTLGQTKDLLLLLRFKFVDGNMPAYGPRVLASFLLQEAINSGQPLSRRSLTQNLHRYGHLVVLSPEGHLVRAYSGTRLRCVGDLRIQNGVPMADGYKVNTFYVQDGSLFREDPNTVAPAIFVLPEQRPLEKVAGGKR